MQNLKLQLAARDKQIEVLKETLKNKEQQEDARLEQARKEIQELLEMVTAVTKKKEKVEAERNELQTMYRLNEEALREMSQDLHIVKDELKQTMLKLQQHTEKVDQ